MSGIALVLELARKSPSFHSAQSLHSYGHFAAASSFAAAAASASAHFAARFLFGTFKLPVAYCDSGTAWSEDNVSSTQSNFENILRDESLKHAPSIQGEEDDNFLQDAMEPSRYGHSLKKFCQTDHSGEIILEDLFGHDHIPHFDCGCFA